MLGFKFLQNTLQSMIGNNAVHPTSNSYIINIPGTKHDYSKDVGSGLGSNVAMLPIQWVMRSFPEAPVKLDKIKSNNQTERVLKHPFLDILKKPNPYYNYEIMIMGTMLSYSLAGNSYLLKVRNEMGMVIELWYMPHWMVTPVGSDVDPTVFISHYEYKPGFETFSIPVEDVIHFRFGLDPKNVRLGLSQLGATIREIATDDQASNYSASILRNMGVPGVVLSPAKEEVEITGERARELKEQFRGSFTGDKRGDPLVMTGPTKIDTFGFDPSQLGLGGLRNISEERVCAALGIPAAVVGFGSGLEQTKVGATMAALIRLAWSGNILPSQRVISQILEEQLLSDFDSDEALCVGFDNTGVLALQEDKNEKVTRLTAGVTAGWATVADARAAEGLPVDESHNVFLRPFSMIEVSE